MKDLFQLLIFKKLYPETEFKARIVDACTGVVIWMLIVIALHFAIQGVISHRHLSYVPPVKKPWRYHYDVITANERAFFSTDEKMMLSERGNIIDIRGGIYFDSAKSIRLIKIKTD